jgi:outer membrane lipoprotein-sorting protein
MLRSLVVCLFGIHSFIAPKAWSFIPDKFQASYEESFQSASSGKMKVSRGSLLYQYPTDLRLEVISPDPSLFITNKTKSWLYTPPFVQGEMGEVKVSAPSHVLPRFFGALKKGDEKNDIYQVEKKPTAWVLKFTAKAQKDLGVMEAQLIPKSGVEAKELAHFEKMELTYTNKKKVSMRFLEFKAISHIKDSDFIFVAPANTKVIEL